MNSHLLSLLTAADRSNCYPRQDLRTRWTGTFTSKLTAGIIILGKVLPTGLVRAFTSKLTEFEYLATESPEHMIGVSFVLALSIIALGAITDSAVTVMILFGLGCIAFIPLFVSASKAGPSSRIVFLTCTYGLFLSLLIG